MKVFIINLKRSPDRRAFMERQAVMFGLDVKLVEATDGMSLVAENIDALYDRERSKSILDKELSANEIACADSHRKALSEFLESQEEYGLIMEDDIELNTDFATSLRTILKSIHRQENMYVQFDYPPSGIKGVMLWWFLFKNLFQYKWQDRRFWVSLPLYLLKGLAANTLSLRDGLRDQYLKARGRHSIAPIRRDRYLAGCYLVTRNCAKTLIEVNTPILYAADAVHNIARRQGKIRHYLCVPRVVRQKREHFFSMINNDHFGKKVIAY